MICLLADAHDRYLLTHMVVVVGCIEAMIGKSDAMGIADDNQTLLSPVCKILVVRLYLNQLQAPGVPISITWPSAMTSRYSSSCTGVQ
jgi:hypothetical protein